jgi:hypothetical protein
MPVITEPFQTLPIYDKGADTFAWIHQPKVTILVKVHGQLYPFTIEAFVDSGATRNLFPADVLSYFNIPVANGQKKFITCYFLCGMQAKKRKSLKQLQLLEAGSKRSSLGTVIPLPF